MAMSDQPTLIDLEERPANTVEDLWSAAQEANAALETAELEYLTEEAWLRDQRWRLGKNEAQIMVKVNAAKVDPDDPESKPLFTNAAMRDAEVSRRKSEDPAYKELMAALLVAENAQAVRKIHIDKLGRDYSLSRLRYEALTIGKRYEH
jgi:hypothetical protein